MSTSTRLILRLTVMVAAVMTIAGYFILQQREAILVTARHNEVRAQALTLQIALEDYSRTERASDAQQLINRYPPEVSRVMTPGEMTEDVRRIKGQEVFSVILPIRSGAGPRDTVEITQPMSLIEADFARARRSIAITTLLLFATIFLVVLVVTRRGLGRPIQELLVGATALGRGDLDYRVIVPQGGSEFARLALEFNRMADHLAEQRRGATLEAEEGLALECELRHRDRLAAVGRLAAGVTHEMGAPLNVVKGRAEQLLARRKALIEMRERYLAIIREQADGMARIVRQLLNLARPFHLCREPIDLAQRRGGHSLHAAGRNAGTRLGSQVRQRK